ncbi:MAG: hypothetical protein K0M40_12285 [Prolixibacteraceae bacterium]|nr:hypothetical protein [Prolixibacteraceae bacterium]
MDNEEKIDNKVKKKVTFNTNVTIVFDKQNKKYTPYTGVKCFTQHNEGYDTDEARNKIYNKVSRGDDYEDEHFLIIKRVLVRPPIKKLSRK